MNKLRPPVNGEDAVSVFGDDKNASRTTKEINIAYGRKK